MSSFYDIITAGTSQDKGAEEKKKGAVGNSVADAQGIMAVLEEGLPIESKELVVLLQHVAAHDFAAVEESEGIVAKRAALSIAKDGVALEKAKLLASVRAMKAGEKEVIDLKGPLEEATVGPKMDGPLASKLRRDQEVALENVAMLRKTRRKLILSIQELESSVIKQENEIAEALRPSQESRAIKSCINDLLQYQSLPPLMERADFDAGDYETVLAYLRDEYGLRGPSDIIMSLEAGGDRTDESRLLGIIRGFGDTKVVPLSPEGLIAQVSTRNDVPEVHQHDEIRRMNTLIQAKLNPRLWCESFEIPISGMGKRMAESWAETGRKRITLGRLVSLFMPLPRHATISSTYEESRLLKAKVPMDDEDEELPGLELNPDVTDETDGSASIDSQSTYLD